MGGRPDMERVSAVSAFEDHLSDLRSTAAQAAGRGVDTLGEAVPLAVAVRCGCLLRAIYALSF